VTFISSTCTPTRLYGIGSQEITFFILMAERTSKLTWRILCDLYPFAITWEHACDYSGSVTIWSMIIRYNHGIKIIYCYMDNSVGLELSWPFLKHWKKQMTTLAFVQFFLHANNQGKNIQFRYRMCFHILMNYFVVEWPGIYLLLANILDSIFCLCGFNGNMLS
jgi:hypothetical protein